MRILTNRPSVPAGVVSLRVATTGSLVHGLVVLPPASGERVGTLVAGTDGRVDETGRVAEASRTCGTGARDGINPGAISCVTVTLSPGNYELVCNLPRSLRGRHVHRPRRVLNWPPIVRCLAAPRWPTVVSYQTPARGAGRSRARPVQTYRAAEH
jgi:hypothetical protein